METTALATKVNSFRGLLERIKPQLSMALPKHLNADRMLRICMTTIQRTPSLMNCTQQSLLGAIMESSQLGLEPDGLLGQAFLVPYGKTCTLIPGYKGLLKLSRNSGEICGVLAKEVYKDDKFRVAFGLENTIVHEPNFDSPQYGNSQAVTFVYAVCKLKSGEVQFDVMSKSQVELIRKRSPAANSGPWVTDWTAMALKTVLRRLCKTLPASVELERAIALDEKAESGIPQEIDFIDIPTEEEKTTETQKSSLDKLAEEKKVILDPGKSTEMAQTMSEPTKTQLTTRQTTKKQDSRISFEPEVIELQKNILLWFKEQDYPAATLPQAVKIQTTFEGKWMETLQEVEKCKDVKWLKHILDNCRVAEIGPTDGEDGQDDGGLAV